MKPVYLLCCFVILPASIFSQNVGIGTNSPVSTLEVKGNIRTGGGTSYLSFDTTSGKITWNNAHLFVTGSQYLMQHSASAEGLFYGNGNLLYRGVADTAFMTNWSTGTTYIRGNTGIGTRDPQAKLHVFNGTSGSGSLSDANLTVESNSSSYIMMLTPGLSESGILFNNNPNAFSGGGILYNTTANPGGLEFRVFPNVTPMALRSNRLDLAATLFFAGGVGQRITFFDVNATQSYGIGIAAGELRLHAATSIDDIVFGHGTSEAFNESARIKANGSIIFSNSLMPSGNAGTYGQVLVSNGPTFAPEWKTRIITHSQTLDFAPTAAQTSQEMTFYVADAVLNDAVVVTPPVSSNPANSCYTAWVADFGQVTIRFNNYSTATINPFEGIFKVTIIKN